MVFCDITREHPAEIYSKQGRGLHVTEEAVYTDSSKRLYLVIDMTTQSGTAEISPLLSKWIAEAFFIYTKYKRKKRTRL